MTNEEAIASIKAHCRYCRMFPKCVNDKPECFLAIEMAIEALSAQPDKDMIHLQKEQAYMQGWVDGQNALREEIWEDGRDRLD